MKKVAPAIGVVAVLVCLCFAFGVSAQGDTTVDISPASQTVSPGQVFTVDAVVDPAVSIAGVQFDLSFDPSPLTASSVAEGNLLNQNGDPTFFLSGTIDNVAGTITGVAGAILGVGKTVSSPGTFATITFTAKTTMGTSPLDLSNVIVGDSAGDPVAIAVTGGSVTIVGPDLVTTEKSEEWVHLADKTYNIDYTVKNLGSAKADPSKTCIYIDGELELKDPVPELAPGVTYTNTVGPFEMTECEGDTIEVCADCDNEVTEGDETNNCLQNELENPGTCSDADCDGKVTMNDGRQIFMYLIYGPEKYPICDAWAADCDGIAGITMNDGRQIFMNLIYGVDKYPLVCQ